MKAAALLGAFLVAGSDAAAQSFEFAPILTYTSPVTLAEADNGATDLIVEGGFAWGARGTWFLLDNFGVEGLWTRQVTRIESRSGSERNELIELTIHQAVANVVYRLGTPAERVRAFAFAGAGTAFLDAASIEAETKFTWNVGAGVKWLLSRQFGVEGHARYKPIVLGENEAERCGVFGLCQNSLRQVDIAAAFLVRF